jgi:hypothetical protein
VIQAGEIAPASYEAFLRYLDDTRKILETPIVLEYR